MSILFIVIRNRTGTLKLLVMILCHIMLAQSPIVSPTQFQSTQFPLHGLGELWHVVKRHFPGATWLDQWIKPKTLS